MSYVHIELPGSQRKLYVQQTTFLEFRLSCKLEKKCTYD